MTFLKNELDLLRQGVPNVGAKMLIHNAEVLRVT